MKSFMFYLSATTCLLVMFHDFLLNDLISFLNIILLQVGHDKEGLPIGLHLMGRPWGEATVFRAASVVEVIILVPRNGQY